MTHDLYVYCSFASCKIGTQHLSRVCLLHPNCMQKKAKGRTAVLLMYCHCTATVCCCCLLLLLLLYLLLSDDVTTALTAVTIANLLTTSWRNELICLLTVDIPCKSRFTRCTCALYSDSSNISCCWCTSSHFSCNFIS